MQKTKLTIFLTVLSLVLFGMAGVVSAAEYYVSPTGASVWANCGGATPLNGASACSWQTAMANALAGDMVYFRGGTYDLGAFDGERGSIAENTRMYPANSGTSGNPITFIAYPGEVPNITGTVAAVSQEAWFGCGYTGAERDYITWDGFSATLIKNQGTYETTIFRVAGDHCAIRNSNLTGVDVGNWAYNTALIRIQDATNGLIENNYLHDLISASYAAVNTSAIYFNMLSNLTTVKNNTIVNSEGGIYGKGNSANVSIYNNFIYNSGNNGLYGIWYKRSVVTGESYTSRKIYQNIIVGHHPNIFFEDNGVGITAFDGMIYNNTLYADNGTNDGIEIQAGHADTQIFNNIIYNQSPSIRYYNGTVSLSDYNEFYRVSGNVWNCAYSSSYTSLVAWIDSGVSCRPIDYDDNSVTTDPTFINPGGSSVADYKRLLYSTNGRGGPHASVMGAYITGDEIIGYVAPTQIQTDTTPPSAPQGLMVN